MTWPDILVHTFCLKYHRRQNVAVSDLLFERGGG